MITKYGFATDGTDRVVCGVKTFPDAECTAGYLLFSYGTKPDVISVCPDSHRKCLIKTESIMQACLEQLSDSDGRTDTLFVAAKINDAIQNANSQVYNIASYLGQSICIGGVFAFFYRNDYLVVPFGGGYAYEWNLQKQLLPLGDPIRNAYITENPIGTTKIWVGKYWNGTLQPGTRLLLCSNPLPNDPKIFEAIETGSQPGNHNDTLPLLLRQVLEKYDLPPVAAMDFHV